MKLTPQEIFDMSPVKFAEFIAEKELTSDQQMKQAIAPEKCPLSRSGAIFPGGISNAVHTGKVRPMKRKAKWRSWAGEALALAVLLSILLTALLVIVALCGVSRHRIEGSGYVRQIWGVRI